MPMPAYRIGGAADPYRERALELEHKRRLVGIFAVIVFVVFTMIALVAIYRIWFELESARAREHTKQVQICLKTGGVVLDDGRGCRLE